MLDCIDEVGRKKKLKMSLIFTKSFYNS
jgi:hypothetical protein